MSAQTYLNVAIETLRRLMESQLDKIHAAAGVMADTVIAGGSLFSFGASHSFIITEEMVYRTGGLMLVNPIYPHGMNLNVRPLTMTSQLERVMELGKELLDGSPARAGDVLIITSTSGRNAVAIDMAIRAHEKKIKTLAITALSYLHQAASRHPSGKKLPELCDWVIDNGVPYGDAAVAIDGFPQKVGPLSSMTGIAIANALVAETVQILVERGVQPPVFMSANLDGGDAYNERLLAQNRHRIHYL